MQSPRLQTRNAFKSFGDVFLDQSSQWARLKRAHLRTLQGIARTVNDHVKRVLERGFGVKIKPPTNHKVKTRELDFSLYTDIRGYCAALQPLHGQARSLEEALRTSYMMKDGA
jgi:hypothetical protein